MSKADKTQSPLVQSVLALDQYLIELERVGEKIKSAPMKTEFDIEQVRRLMVRFAEYGQGVSTEVTNLSTRLNEARARAEAIATEIGKRADELNGVSATQQEVWERFRALNEKVQELNRAITALKKPAGEEYTDQDRKRLSDGLTRFETQFDSLIEESRQLRKEAQELRMKTLEQNADSLAQTLQSVRNKIRVLNPSTSAH